MNNARCVLTFILGVAVGSVATWKLVKTKYEQIAQEEIDSYKEHFTYKKSDESEEITEKPAEENTEKVVYNDILKNYAPQSEKEDEVNKPYVITPEEFGECDGYETVSLTYFADRVLTDERNNLIEDVVDTIGADSLSHFGEYEDDSVFVRNDRLMTDYEILLDTRRYVDIVNQYDSPVGDE